MADEVVLLSYWGSPFGLRVQIALAEKGVVYKYKEEDLFNRSPLLLETNPIYKKVPVLIHNGKPIIDSLLILQYIDEVWSSSGPSLLPHDPHQRAQARFWGEFTNKIYEGGSKLWKKKGDVKAEAKEEVMECLKVLEAELGDKPFFGGDSFGYVDIALVTMTTRFYSFHLMGGFSVEEECPKLVAWAKRCMERESVSKVLPDHRKVYEFMCYVKKKLGLE